MATSGDVTETLNGPNNPGPLRQLDGVGEGVRVPRAEAAVGGPRIHRERRVQVRVAEQRPRG